MAAMTVQDPTGGEAVLTYSDSDYAILKPGRFVRCAVSGRPIPLEVLRYWSAEHQEAYAGPVEATQRLAPAAG
jgi:hypothetical protein